MAEESKGVVYAALAGNLAIAVTKFGAAAFSGSAGMLSEAVHSTVDTLDQLLLLVGEARGRRAPDRSHPFGYGLEVYFWTFTVSLMVFLLGGAFSVYEGVHKLARPEPVKALWINALVLAAAAVFEGASFFVGYRAYRKRAGRGGRGRKVGLFSFIRRSKDPNLFVTLLEDGAALIGLALAGLGVAGQVRGWPWADGASSIAIGVLLMAVAAVLANETRSLIAGESADGGVTARIDRALEGASPRVARVDTLQLGPDKILAVLTLDAGGASLDAAAELEGRVRGADPRIWRVHFDFVRPPQR